MEATVLLIYVPCSLHPRSYNMECKKVVLPLLYCTTVWSPHTRTDAIRAHAVQGRAVLPAILRRKQSGPHTGGRRVKLDFMLETSLNPITASLLTEMF